MQTVSPETQGFSSQRLARINTVMQRYVDQKQLAGMSTLIARCGQIVHFETFGLANITTGQPMAEDTIFHIYSMTKPITCAAALMLLEEGRFRLTDPISQYIPAFKNQKVLEYLPNTPARLIDPAREIIIHDLFTHSAGLAYGFDETEYLEGIYARDVMGPFLKGQFNSLAEFVNQIAKMPLAFHPGTRFRYSLAQDVLGYLIEVVSGMPFQDFLQQRVFGPLGMVDTSFTLSPDKAHRLAAIHGKNEQGQLSIITTPLPMHWDTPNPVPSGGGGLLSTMGDYYRFAQMLAGYGELDSVRLLGRKTVELMAAPALAPGVHLWDDPAQGYGLGVGITLDLGRSMSLGSVGMYGWGGAANTNFRIDPRENLLYILMLQYMPSDTYPVVNDFRNLVYQALIDEFSSLR